MTMIYSKAMPIIGKFAATYLAAVSNAFKHSLILVNGKSETPLQFGVSTGTLSLRRLVPSILTLSATRFTLFLVVANIAAIEIRYVKLLLARIASLGHYCVLSCKELLRSNYTTKLAILLLLLLVGCSAKQPRLDTTICDPAKEMCFAVSVPFLEKHFFTEEQNYMLKENLKVCREKL